MIDDALNHFGDFVVVIGSNAIEVGHALHSSVFPQENKSASIFGSTLMAKASHTRDSDDANLTALDNHYIENAVIIFGLKVAASETRMSRF